jgi:hypothetical protein
VVASFRQLFDFLAETTAIATCAASENGAKSVKNDIWLGDKDSNLDSRSQSPQLIVDLAVIFSQLGGRRALMLQPVMAVFRTTNAPLVRGAPVGGR